MDACDHVKLKKSKEQILWNLIVILSFFPKNVLFFKNLKRFLQKINEWLNENFWCRFFGH